MPYNSDIPLTGNPLSASYKEAINGMRSDLARLNQYLPLLEGLSSTYAMSSGGGGKTYPIMGRIVAHLEQDSGVDAPAYFWEEEQPLEGAPRQGFCANVMEIGLICNGDAGDFIPPGLSVECIGEIFPGGNAPNYNCSRIAVGTVVLLHDSGRLTQLDDTSKLWLFSCPVPMCVECPSDPEP
jgi:hypothetical protein